MSELKLKKLSGEMKSDLIENILPYWMNTMRDETNGGFYGQINGDDELVPKADKGGILNARILWTFSSAYNDLKDKNYLEKATLAYNYIIDHFFDERNGGTFWSLQFDGQPQDTKKQIYSQAFFIYALTEYYKATELQQSLDKAIELFYLIEKHSFDKSRNGYMEAFSQNWELLEDLRLSEKDANENKTMNTHLHILEAYTNLYRVWKDEQVKFQLDNLIELFLDQITDQQNFHLNLFFNDDWECKSSIISYGHDIEASWLIYEAAEVLGNKELLEKARLTCIKIVQSSMEGLQEDGSLIYEKDLESGHIDYERHWWPQAEAVVGFLNAFEMTREDRYIDHALKCWEYIQSKLVDHANGEWFWSILEDGNVNRKEDKAGFWKCPYHNSRACLETIRRVNMLCKIAS
ncbi:AGE family epimerase/isomerase [Sunxiuqinia sp. A32]|uniref:AGE family epimerase/isomerase n=1 Tax=Sunxiuqinia sp. A32 TaxID=3461496 RepID=UPI004045A8A3